jgi:dihydroorotate dehydrogenase (fumarate)
MGIDLSTNYLGLKLRNPLVIAASPVSMQVQNLERLQAAGAAAVVLASLFEEEIEADASAPHASGGFLLEGAEVAEKYEFDADPDAYLRYIEAAKKAVSIPIIGSLNGVAKGDWLRFARLIQEAGADALELNVYFLATQPDQTAEITERRYVELVADVRSRISIPLAIKVGPFFSSLPNFVRRLVSAGADGLVLFNRFLQPDIDLDSLDVVPNLMLSHREELRLPLRWIAILRGQTQASLAATSGIHFAEDLLKLILAGADAGMLASAVIRNGPDHVRLMLAEMEYWLTRNHFDSIEQIKGRLSQQHCTNPSAFERINYVRTIKSLANET